MGFLLTASCVAACAQSPMSIDVRAESGELEVRFKDQKLLVYAFASNQFKPYVRELYTLRGENVLRDAPADHLHHHGLMYAIRANGINFWEEREAPGIEKPVQLLAYVTGKSPAGLPQAQFIQSVHWLAFTNRAVADSAAKALLLEQRTLTVIVDEKNQEVALRWQSDFEVGRKAGKVNLHGSNYNGLGLRLPASFDHTALFLNSANQADPAPGTQNVTPGKWTSVAGKIGDRDVTAVLFGSSVNAGGDAKYFTMTEPFAYLAATQGLDQAPLDYGPGAKFQLSYLLTIYSEKKSREFNENRAQRWQREKQ
jgi:hypothetical protein